MAIKDVTAKLGREENARVITVNYDLGNDLADAVEKFGEAVVFSRFEAAVTVDIQAIIRRHGDGEDPKTDAQIQDLLADWKPGVQRKKKSPQEKALAIMADMSPEDRQALIDQLEA